MKRIFFLWAILTTLFVSNTSAQVKYYISEYESLSNDNSSCVVVYFNNNKSRFVCTFISLGGIKADLMRDTNCYEKWGNKYINNSTGRTDRSFVYKYQQNVNNAHIYVSDPQETTMLGFNLDFTKLNNSPSSSSFTIYKEFKKSDIMKPLF